MSSNPPPASDIAITLRDVSKSYVLFERPEDRLKQMVVPRLERLVGREPRRYFRDFAALSGVSFDIRRGETVGIVGRNGSGKSTLLQIVCGTLQPTAGAVEVRGRIAALLELGAGFNPEFTGRENVFLNASILGVPAKEMEWRFDEIARFADIGPFLDQPVKTYSSGMYMRLAFATAVNVDPDILVVDEALAVGDEAFQRKCFARMEQIKESGGTILFVSHGAQTVVQLCTRAILIDGGELILQGRPKMVTDQYHRLVNASPERAVEIRAGIVAMGGEAAETSDAPAGESARGGASVVADLPPETVAQDGLAEYYDPNVQSKTTIAHEERGARIENPRLLTLDGRPVNVLQLGKRYIFAYTVKFTADVEDVSFGMHFSTVPGLALAGAHTGSVRSMLVKKVRSGESLDLRFEFNCHLMPSVYLATCGTRGTLAGDHIILHRITEAFMFRVAPESMLLAAMHVDLGVVCAIEKTQEASASDAPNSGQI